VRAIEGEKNPDTLRQIALLLSDENSRLIERLRKLTEENSRLRGMDPAKAQAEIAALKELLAMRERKIFGRSSEKRTGDEPPSEEPTEKTSQKGHGPKAQPELAVVVEQHELPEDERQCGACGGTVEPMGDQAEESEEITVVERRFLRVRHRRRKYRCRCNGCVVTAPGPAKVIPGGRYSIDFAVEVIAQKYIDHLPLERQVRIMRREGLEISSQTLWDQLWAGSQHLKPSYEAILDEVLSAEVVGADETHWKMLSWSGRDQGTNKRWWAWNVTSEKGAAFRILDSRSAEAAREVLGRFDGVVMADGYGAYESLARGEPKRFVLAHCWAHVRRKFIEIESNFPHESTEMIGLIRELYEIEKLASPGPEGDQLRRKLRDERSREVIRRILDWMAATPALPQSGLGKAIAYTKGMWEGLVRFLDDPHIPLDNNAAERSIRGPVIGRKNYYGSKSRRGTEVAALYYTLIETAKLLGVEPKTYLRTALRKAIEQPGTAVLPGELLD
jgi:transposase